ncbi:ATP-grasp domain-containing protein [Gordonia sp. TBRC 11910]|uniref:acetyl-CoA carboxylase n=1 Tax=Gordonia asplenii TaxID=2725283 RepID=A0A848L016_9ACTN|nr:carboxyl transferase domain-containing protein [Gordonia asplenii]NMO03812.1 ATP-grasp domain-containing protein [Gordonia asplenii]
MTPQSTLLIANRGEIALRIIRTATELGLRTVAVYADDDADTPHVRAASTAVALPGAGPSAYLNQQAVLDAAEASGATLVHPGYGFLAENWEFARRCAGAGLTFVGPSPELLATFGDKRLARSAAVAAGVPVVAATSGDGGLDEIRVFFDAAPSGIMIKAVAGGGGRGMREVHDAADIESAYRACAAEAELGFGSPEVFVEQLLGAARHIEVQVVAAASGDGHAYALALGDRDCSVQRRHQKLIEVAPAQDISPALRRSLHAAAVTLIAREGYCGLATVEFLVSGSDFVFLEVNPRIQVEHTVTEEVTDTDLVAVSLAIATGTSFGDLRLPPGVSARDHDVPTGEPASSAGVAIQVRINMETTSVDGQTIPSTGTLTEFTPPSGPGVRVDTYGRTGLTISPRYDSLLAKVIVYTRVGGVDAAVRKALGALDEFAVAGVATNIGLQRAILSDNDFQSGVVDTAWLGARMSELVESSGPASAQVSAADRYADDEVIRASMAGIVVETADESARIAAGGQVAVLEAMKMQHVVSSAGSVVVERVLVRPGQSVNPGDPLLAVAVDDAASGDHGVDDASDHERADLTEIIARHEITLDAARPAAVAKVHGRGRRTARENIADLVDDGSFVEYGALAIAAQRSRRSEQDLIENTPADGLVGGTATIGAERFGSAAEVVVMSYDYSVLAGTQGMRNHAKTDRLLELAARKRVPLILFAEGGGGRPGDTDWSGNALDVPTFRTIAALNGRVPTVSIVSGRCFAGNAALAGACDALIATPDANIGMGGPAMVEGGGLGVYRPEEIGPIHIQRRNGVVDLAADDEQHAVGLAKQYLSYFQGSVDDWRAPDPDLARAVVPENRLRAYDVRRAVAAIADVGSVLELRPDYGIGIVTALIRVEGVAYGVLANSSRHLGGAIDAEASDKASDFLALCETHRMPIVMLCDTPGFMVGPESEKDATVRRFGRMFIAGARLTVPFGAIILRKGYGLGAMAMTGGSFHAPEFTVAWPTGEIGPMGLEGGVRLGFRKELEAIDDATERDRVFTDLVAAAYQQGKALTAATAFELDDVIDPADSRRWIATLGTG